MKTEKVNFLIHIDKTLAIQIRHEAITQEKTYSQFLTEIVENYFINKLDQK